MNTAHTPGPWFERKNVSGVYAIVITTAEGTAIATVNRLDLREGLPNARLIAAAPDLLDIAHLAEQIAKELGLLQVMDVERSSQTYQDLLRIRAVITKATAAESEG